MKLIAYNKINNYSLIAHNLAMNELQALIQGKIPPQAIQINDLLKIAEQHTDPNSAEYKLVELAINIVLATALEKALKYV